MWVKNKLDIRKRKRIKAEKMEPRHLSMTQICCEKLIPQINTALI